MWDANTVLLITNEIICQIQFWYMTRVVRVWIDLMRIEKRPLKAFFNTEPRPCQFSVIQSKNFFFSFSNQKTQWRSWRYLLFNTVRIRQTGDEGLFWPDVREKQNRYDQFCLYIRHLRITYLITTQKFGDWTFRPGRYFSIFKMPEGRTSRGRPSRESIP